jgi:hypothetical protein
MVSTKLPKPEYVSKTGLKYRGWSEKAIEQFLHKPDKTAPNPHGRRAAWIKLYSLNRVLIVEQSERYKNFVLVNQSKRLSAKKAVETKRQNLLEYVESCKIHVVRRPIERVTKEAIEAYNWHKFEVSHGWDYTPASESSNRDFLDRITVNYLRHQMSSYEEKLFAIYGKVGTSEAYKILVQRIYFEISKAYPEFRLECDNQLARKLGAYQVPVIVVTSVESARQTTLF